jgi:hypothetical protein
MHCQLAKSEVLTLVLLKVQVFQVVALCQVVVPSILKERKPSKMHAPYTVKHWKLLTQWHCCILTKLGSAVNLAVRSSNLTGNRTHFDVTMTLCVDIVLQIQFSYSSCHDQVNCLHNIRYWCPHSECSSMDVCFVFRHQTTITR